MTVINSSIKSIIVLTIMSGIFGCIEPNSEDIWTLNKVAHVETEGYCRDVFISGDSVFVAAGQAGIQLWDISNITAPTLVWKKSLSELGVSKEISQVEYEASIRQLFALESNERPIHIDLSKGDSMTVVGQFSSEMTKEFRVVTNSAISFTVYAADFDDGLKVSTFEYDSSFGLWFNTTGNEIVSVGNPNGIDINNNTIILTLDQLGIESFNINGSSITSAYHIDLDGNARAATIENIFQLFIACEDGGAYRMLRNREFSKWEHKTQFAENLFVTHVAVYDMQIALSCARNGIGLYEQYFNRGGVSISERGIHDIGYVYHSEFANGYLFAATREGLQIFEIVE